MKNILIGFLIGALAVLGGWRAKVTYDWKKNVDQRGYLSDVSAEYLFGPSGVVLNGKSVSRQQLIDMLLHDAVDHKK